jgi:hypothetical protein
MPIEAPQVAPNSSQSRATLAATIDIWAVALALGLSFLVYIGVIKHVPW